MEDKLIPLDKHDNGSNRGYLVLKFPFDREIVLKVLNEMNLELPSESKESLQYFVMEKPEEFLELYWGVKYTKEILFKAKINEVKKAVYFITKRGGLIVTSQQILFLFEEGSLIHEFHKINQVEYYFLPDLPNVFK